MSEIKLSLSIVLPGRTMKSKQECLENPKDAYSHSTLEVVDGKHREIIHINTRKCRTAKQSINISKEAYYAMISDCPAFVKTSVWKTMGKNARINAHMNNICEHLGGISYSYEVFED